MLPAGRSRAEFAGPINGPDLKVVQTAFDPIANKYRRWTGPGLFRRRWRCLYGGQVPDQQRSIGLQVLRFQRLALLLRQTLRLC